MNHTAAPQRRQPLPAAYGPVLARLVRKYPEKSHAEVSEALRNAVALIEHGVSRAAIFAAADLFLGQPASAAALRRVFQ